MDSEFKNKFISNFKKKIVFPVVISVLLLLLVKAVTVETADLIVRAVGIVLGCFLLYGLFCAYLSNKSGKKEKQIKVKTPRRVKEKRVKEKPVKKVVVERPVVEAPPVEQPVVEQPVVEQPVVEAPPVEIPPVEQPPVEQPPVEQEISVPETLVVEQPIVEEKEIDVKKELPVKPVKPVKKSKEIKVPMPKLKLPKPKMDEDISKSKPSVDLIRKAQMDMDIIKRKIPKFSESAKPKFDIGSTKMDFDSDDLSKEVKQVKKTEAINDIDSCRLFDIAKRPETITAQELELITKNPEIKARYEVFLKKISDTFDKNKNLYYLKRL